jgi:peptidoglycan/xylan/chitin deacetylase (PgdA/CDA1 family)
MFGRGKRELIANTLQRIGVLRLLEKLPFTDSLLVLNYHRVMKPEDCPYDHGVISATPDQFYEQVSYFKSRSRVIGLAELVAQLEKGRPSGGFQTMITFDDGYVDNYQYAFPALRSLGAPALFFVPTSYIDTTAIPWWDQVAHLVRCSDRRTLRLDYPEKRTLSLDAMPVDEVIRTVIGLYRSPEVKDTERFLSMLERECRAQRVGRAYPPLFMSWDQVREMAANGMDIGSHTHSHAMLSRLSEEAQLAELRQSREVLQQKLQSRLYSLAIPTGHRDSFNDATHRALDRAQYQVAFTFYGGVNRGGDLRRFDIKRVGVGRTMSFARVRLMMLQAATLGRSW